MKSFILLFILISSSAAFSQTDLQKFVAQGCQDFKSKLVQVRGTSFGYEQVPQNWNNPNGPKIPLFWWKRAGSANYPPLLLVHGGPGANSSGFLLRMPKLIETYPGVVFALDERGEGCSNTLPANLPPSAYAHLRTRNSVYDIEFLRQKYFKLYQWRALGQSRGSIILHYYLDMFPNSLESVHAHGWSILPANLAPGITRLRAKGYQRTAAAYAKKYPQDVALVSQIRSTITPMTCWQSYESRQYCGPQVLDIFGFDLSRVALWENLHKTLNSALSPNGSVDVKKVYGIMNERIKTDLFAHANYIVGTLALDVSYPDHFTLLKLQGTPEFEQPLLTEIRWLRNGILPKLPFVWRTSTDTVDYGRIRRFLASNPKFKYYLYSGDLDPVAPFEMFDYEVRTLSPYVRYTKFRNSGHDGWWSEPLVTQRLLEFSN